jgi:hypothetical protein
MNEHSQNEKLTPAKIFILCALMFIVLATIIIIFSVFKGSSIIKNPSKNINIASVPDNQNALNFGANGSNQINEFTNGDLTKDGQANTVNTNNWKSYSDNPLGMSIRYPAGY